jgi:hypothetical protein
LLNDQSGSVLGDSTVFSWAGCHIGLQVDGAHEAMEMALTEFMEDVGGKLDAMEKISKLYAKVFQK